ncbi:hypothetical protein Ms3S1_35870 [Methylosinus sp. 3S-1]
MAAAGGAADIGRRGGEDDADVIPLNSSASQIGDEKGERLQKQGEHDAAGSGRADGPASEGQKLRHQTKIRKRAKIVKRAEWRRRSVGSGTRAREARAMAPGA